MKHWINTNYKSLIIAAFLIPIITVAIVSISHVTKWYGISNPLSWAIYLSIGVEIAALSALAAISADMGKKVYFPFIIVTLVQFVGNIFFAYSYIDVTSKLFVDWVDLVSPLVSFMGVEPTDLIGHKRFLAFFAGGMLPIISLSFLHMLVKFTEEDRKKEMQNPQLEISNEELINQAIEDYKKKQEENKIDASDLISEVSRIRLSEEDLKVLENALLNPPKTNENLKNAATYYKQKVRETEELKVENKEIEKPKVNDTPISREETELVLRSRADILAEMMQKDEELGLYDPPFDNPLVKEPVVSDDFTIGPEGAFEMTEEIQKELQEDDWDSTLLDGLEDEGNDWGDLPNEDLIGDDEFSSTLEPTEEEESKNFSTIERNTDNFFQNNVEDSDGQFEDWGIETVPNSFSTENELEEKSTFKIELVNPSDEDEKKK